MKFNEFMTMAMRQAKDQAFRDIQNGAGITVSYPVAASLSGVAWDWLRQNFNVTNDGDCFSIKPKSSKVAQ